MKKILFTASVDNHINSFHIPYINLLIQRGHQVDVASKGNSIIPKVKNKFNIPFPRKPNDLFSFFKSYSIIKNILLYENYDIVHTHTPFTSMLVRFAYINIRKKIKTKILYTAHGFHFYKGSSFFSWLIIFPIEYYLSFFTNLLIVINIEDLKIARKFFKCKVVLLNGVGFKEKPIGISNTNNNSNNNCYRIISIGELSNRKNHIFILKAIKCLVKEFPNIELLIVGYGSKRDKLFNYVKVNKLEKNVVFTGYRSDVYNLLVNCNLFISTSYQEGLPISVLEALNSSIPILVSRIRGHIDICSRILEPSLFDMNLEILVKKIRDTIQNYSKYYTLTEHYPSLLKKYRISTLLPKYESIYNEFLKND